MISADGFYGKAVFRSITADLTITRQARVWCISANAGRTVSLRTAVGLSIGTRFYVLNIGSNSFNLRDAGGGLITAVAAGSSARVTLLANGTAAGSWSFRVRALGTNSTAMPVLDVFVIGGTGTATAATRYDVMGAAWTTGTSSPRNRVEGCAGRVGALGLVTGNFPVDTASDDVDFIDGGGNWITGYVNDVMGTGRTMAATLDGRTYQFSGDSTVAAAKLSRTSALAIAACPIAKTRGTAVGIGAWALLIAGEPVSTANIAYNKAGDFYSTITTYSQPTRRSLASFAINGYAFIVGGRRDSPLTRYDAVERFDFLAQTWTAKTALTLGTRYGGAGVGGNAQGTYCGGFDGTDTASNGVASYVDDAWRSETNLPGARSGVDNLGVSI